MGGELRAWVRQAPVERGTLPAAAVLWTAAELMHAGHLPVADISIPSLIATSVTFGMLRGKEHGGLLTGTLAAAGAWLTLGDWAGPMSGPYWPLSVAYACAALGGYWRLRGHEAVAAAREWRRARADWLWQAPEYGLHGSHLLAHEQTRLGEAMEVDVTGTGRRASHYAMGTLAEIIAEKRMLPPSRVQVTPAPIAGRIRISVRDRDPWKNSPRHPVLDSSPEIELPVPCTIRQPVALGQDPETGKPLLLTLWDSTGSKNVLVVGKKGAGKSCLLSCVRERVTAADDALLFDVNLSKAQEDHEWSPACDVTAISRQARRRALSILRCASHAIEFRGNQPRDEKNIVPSRAQPLIVVMIDEVDTLTRGGDHLAGAIKEELEYISSKDRSEAVALILAGQRGTADWMGGSNVRSQVDIVCLGKVSRRGEMHHAAGDKGLTLPDMSTYGEGHPGVWVISDDSDSYTMGRTFDLTELTDIRAIARARAGSQPQIEAPLVASMGRTYAALKDRVPVAAGTAGSAPPDDHDGPESPDQTQGQDPPPDPLSALDREVEDALPDDLRDKIRKIDARSADTRRILADIDAIDLPEVPAGKLAAHTAARWEQLAAATEIPAGARQALLALLAEAGEAGASGRRLADSLGVKRHLMMTWLNRLRSEGLICLEGTKSTSRWRLAGDPEAAQ